MTVTETIAKYFADVDADDPEAIGIINDVFYEKLAAIARRKFGNFPRRVADEYAVANTVLQEFHQRVQRGELRGSRDSAELLMILGRMTRDRTVDDIRRFSAEKRGGGKTRGHSIFVETGGHLKSGDFDRFHDDQETPSSKQIAAEEVRQLLGKLGDPLMRTIFVLRYEGLTNEEIAEQLQISVATVERKRRRIRDCLTDDDPKELNVL